MQTGYQQPLSVVVSPAADPVSLQAAAGFSYATGDALRASSYLMAGG